MILVFPMVCLVHVSTGIIKWSDAITAEKIICKFMVRILSVFREMKKLAFCIEKPAWAEYLTQQIGLGEVAFKERIRRF